MVLRLEGAQTDSCPLFLDRRVCGPGGWGRVLSPGWWMRGVLREVGSAGSARPGDSQLRWAGVTGTVAFPELVLNKLSHTPSCFSKCQLSLAALLFLKTPSP